ncbi:MAG: hypothetical protein LBP87_03120, partial [Planctomycetaceae bacterium]|nr:hypothetical protein [Planctomycetaceae bacterium]
VKALRRNIGYLLNLKLKGRRSLRRRLSNLRVATVDLERKHGQLSASTPTNLCGERLTTK